MNLEILISLKKMGLRGLFALGINRFNKLMAAVILHRSLRKVQGSDGCCFLILMPGAVHIGWAAVRVLLRNGLEPILILNGLSRF